MKVCGSNRMDRGDQFLFQATRIDFYLWQTFAANLKSYLGVHSARFLRFSAIFHWHGRTLKIDTKNHIKGDFPVYTEKCIISIRYKRTGFRLR
ncbi:hypothetical protein CEXT_48691 [Caerostris extrusa]|uniref:Uncharacterized protein n=1 Tax=Caerostris extrusa TaxID=172846 RepID=A0AAV4NRW1_CAEEX|nr:hypothetical protein CEXT_48691 [Caerostris extrusa]